MKAEDDELIFGLVNLCELKLGYFNMRKSKRSSEMALRMIWKMLSDPEYKLRATVQRTFSGFSLESFKLMDLGKHYMNYVQGHNRIKTKENVALELVKFIKQRRLKEIFPLSTIIKKEKHEKAIIEDLKALEAKKQEEEK
jgi:hypothetical protein